MGGGGGGGVTIDGIIIEGSSSIDTSALTGEAAPRDVEAGNEIVINDEIKNHAAQAIDELKALGLKKITMLTGDTKLSAENIAETLGLTEVYSELLPDEKCEYVELIKKRNVTDSGKRKGRIIFVGDGINDAPSLAISDVDIAMGGVSIWIAVFGDVSVALLAILNSMRALNHKMTVKNY
jgi:P-type E1-E2 ATPase